MYQTYVAVGRTTRDVELKYAANGTAVGNFGLAINKRIKKNDEWVEKTTFLDCVVFGKTAETMAEYVTKGRLILINGELQNNNWTNKDGEKRSRVEVIINDFKFLEKNDKGEKKDTEYSANVEEGEAPAINDNDIPF